MPLRRDTKPSAPIPKSSSKKFPRSNQHDLPAADPLGQDSSPQIRSGKGGARQDSTKSESNAGPYPDVRLSTEPQKRSAASLKIDLNDAYKLNSRFNPYVQGQLPASKYDPRQTSRPQQPVNSNEADRKSISTFDDTESIRFDDSSVHTVESQPALFRGDGIIRSASAVPHDTTQQQPFQGPPLGSLGPNWQHEVAEERKFLGLDANATKHQPYPDFDYLQETLPKDDNPVAQHVAAQDTPSRPNKLSPGLPKAMAGQNKSVAFTHIPLFRTKALTRHGSHNSSEQHQPLDDASFSESFDFSHRGQLSGKSSRTASFKGSVDKTLRSRSHFDSDDFDADNDTEPMKPSFRSSGQSVATISTDDETLHNKIRLQPPSSPATEKLSRKRVRADRLDYEPEVLANMTYAQLDEQEFAHDPQSRPTPGTIGGENEPMDFNSQLEQLGDYQEEEEQRAFFHAQTDDDWAKTGSWFVEKFTHDLKQLMQARCERRKVSMRYEQILRRRQKEIEFRMTDVDRELGDLRKGGGQLIEGRKFHAGSGEASE